jgi:hypothetical protein
MPNRRAMEEMMSWLPVRRSTARTAEGVVLSLARQRLRNGRLLSLVRIRIDATVMREAGLVLGSWVEILRGEGEDNGKLGLRKSDEQRGGFRISGHSRNPNPSGQLSFDAALLGLSDPPPVPATRVDYRIGRTIIELNLPTALRAGASQHERTPFSAEAQGSPPRRLAGRSGVMFSGG